MAARSRSTPDARRPARASRSAPVRLAASCARRSARRSARLAHLRDELLDRRVVQRAGRDHDALLRERAAVGGHRPRHAPADVGVVGAAGGEPEQRPRLPAPLAARHVHRAGHVHRVPSVHPAGPVREDGRDDGDVGQVGAAGERVVEDPRDARRVLLVEDRGDGRGHRAEVHGDVLGLHDHLAVGVEQRGGGVAALLDVGGVRRADQHHAHLLAGRAQRAGRAPAARSDRARSRAAVARRRQPPVSVDLARPAGGDEQGGLGQRAHGRTADPRARRQLTASTAGIEGSPAKTIAAVLAATTGGRRWRRRGSAAARLPRRTRGR